MKSNMLRKLGATTAIFVVLSSVPSLGQSLPVVAGCKATDFVEGSLENQIKIVGTAFSPKCLRVKVGSSITIEASTHHPLTPMAKIGDMINPFSDQPKFFSAQTRVMTAPGLFGYFCKVHGDPEGDGMAGAILVEPAVGEPVVGEPVVGEPVVGEPTIVE